MGVEFNDEQLGQNTQPEYPGKHDERGISGLIIKAGLAKNGKQANLVMIVMIVVLLGVIALFVL